MIKLVDLPLVTIGNLSSDKRHLHVTHLSNHSLDTTGTPHLTEASYLGPSGTEQMRCVVIIMLSSGFDFLDNAS